jgi:hypothetical protein
VSVGLEHKRKEHDEDVRIGNSRIFVGVFF